MAQTMAMSMHIRYQYLLLITALLWAFLGSAPVFGNTDRIESAPINLSRSGTAVAPVVLHDSAGTLHIIWEDRFDGFTYISGQGADWTQPAAVVFPFSNPPFSAPTAANFSSLLTPKLLLDGTGQVHAFWQLERSLLYSNAPIETITDRTAWSTPQTVASSASAYAVTVAADSRLHLAHIRTVSADDLPPGVYYRQQTPNGWSDANLLYQSSYLRAAPVEQLHVDIAILGSGTIFVSWDNPLIDSIFYVQSTSAGTTWSEPILVDQRGAEDSFETPGPHYLQFIAHDGNIHMLWNRYSNAGRCELVHHWSANGGSQWHVQPALFDGADCPAHRHPLVDETTDLLYLLTEQEQGNLAVRAWLESEWSTPEIKSGMLNFANPETFRAISLTCLQPIARRDRLLVVGCGSGDVADVWLMTNGLPIIADFTGEQTEQWESPSVAIRSSSEQYAPILLPGPDHLIHMLWLEPGVSVPPERVSAVHYAHWDGMRWSRPAPIVEGQIDEMAAVMTLDSRILLVWRDLQEGALWFSQVNAAQAAFPAQWSPPLEFVINEPAISHPTLLATADGRIYVGYALTLNEGRGIYLRRSDDGGLNWTEPTLVYDAVATGRPMINSPSLAQTADGVLHMMWPEYSKLQDNQPAAYYYTRSVDNGVTWSDPPVLAIATATQGQIIAAGNTLFRLWQDIGDGSGILWYQQSENAGLTWTAAALLPSLGDLTGSVSTVIDPAGRPHLLHVNHGEPGTARLDRWFWEASGWQADERAIFELALANDRPGLAAAVLDNGTFLLTFTGLMAPGNSQNPEVRLFYTTRPITLPDGHPPAEPVGAMPLPETARSNEVEEAQAVEEEQLLPSPTIDFAALSEESTSRTQFGPINTSTTTGRILAGVLPAGLIVLMGVILGLYTLRMRKS
jgi:hypothetical protein